MSRRRRGREIRGKFRENVRPLDNPEINNAVGRRGLFVASAKMKSVRCEWQPTANGGGGGRDDRGNDEPFSGERVTSFVS